MGIDETKQEAIDTVESGMCKIKEHQNHSQFRAEVKNLDTGEIITWKQFEPDLMSLLDAM